MAVEVDIYGRNMDVTERLHDYITSKVSKLDRYLNGIEEARVDLSYVKSARSASDRQIAQITISGKGFILRAEERADDIFAALDTALDKIQRQIERFKGKRYQKNRRDGKSASIAAWEAAGGPDVEVAERTAPVIARRKKFVLDPMDEIEAVEQMQLLGHQSFFVFYNVATDSINVLYTRRDGTYGLIETELG